MDDLLRDFLAETRESIAVLDADLVALETSPDPALLQSVFRLFHTIKGTCGFLGLPRLEALAHAAENVLGRLREGELDVTPDVVSAVLATIDGIRELLAAIEANEGEPPGEDGALVERLGALGPAMANDAAPRAEQQRPPPQDGREPAFANDSIRVAVALLDSLMTMASELVLTRNQLLQLLRSEAKSAFAAPLQRLSQVTTELQESVVKTRMQPIGAAWTKLPRVVRDVARDLDKSIELDMRGAGTELDRQVLELIRDPLTHMVRNAADHGIEPPDERERLGKPRAGRIKLGAHHKGGHIVIEIADDGRGLALDKIRARVLADGLASEGELAALSEDEICRFVFRPGFSTAAALTSISGRGVGLDVVRANIERLGGTISIASIPGEGTTFTIVLPLTLAIVSALIVECAGERFAVPQMAVLELVKADTGAERKIEWLNRTPVMRLRNRLLPLVSLRRLLRLGDDAIGDTALVVVTEVAGRAFGMVVDGIDDVEEIVVKPVAPMLRGLTIFAGNTILGDGSVIMILDPAGIAAANGGIGVTQHGTMPAASASRAADRRMSLLLFRTGDEGLKAVPLGIVARLEEIDLAAVEVAADRPVVQYRGRLMPLVTIPSGQRLERTGLRPVVVFAHGDGVTGLVVDEIEDIVDEAVAIERTADVPGIAGSAIIAGQATDIIDVGFILGRAVDRAAPLDGLARQRAQRNAA
jgi:two-component system, chemotaxis family, sensor kinase CheA